LRLAADQGARSVAFPGISTGVYGYPVRQAAEVAVQAVRDFVAGDDRLDEVRFIVFSEGDLQVYRALLPDAS
ncbi:MAG: macro domain-containing protein, partial [Candidatus Eremiobacterota bacterium]